MKDKGKRIEIAPAKDQRFGLPILYPFALILFVSFPAPDSP